MANGTDTNNLRILGAYSARMAAGDFDAVRRMLAQDVKLDLVGKLSVQGWLYDVKNTASPQVLGKVYTDSATEEAARLIAHKFADEIILRLGGGIGGIAESKIYFVSDRSGHKEIWVMDYDGSNQRQVTHQGTISISPRISPDGSRLATNTSLMCSMPITWSRFSP